MQEEVMEKQKESTGRFEDRYRQDALYHGVAQDKIDSFMEEMAEINNSSSNNPDEIVRQIQQVKIKYGYVSGLQKKRNPQGDLTSNIFKKGGEQKFPDSGT
jgi:hypothetical protein